MRKKKVIKPHEIKPDPKFASVIVSRLTNKIMKNGKKRTARKVVYKAAEIVEKWYKEQKEKKMKEEKITQGVVEEKEQKTKTTSEIK